MKPCFAVLAALAALLGFSGCVTSSGARQDHLPPDWTAALPKPGSPAADLAGVYVELGEKLDARFTRDGTVSRANLSLYLSPKTVSSQEWRRLPARNATTELRAIDATHVEVIARLDDTVTDRYQLEVGFEKETGTTVLRRIQSGTNAVFLAAGTAALTFRLWRAPDGRLYLNRTSHAVGEMLLLVPLLTSTETWLRWDPATPAGLQHQAAIVDQAAADQARLVELNRQRARVGAPAPALTGTDLLTGRPVTDADYEGKVLLLHVWSTRTGTRTLKPVQDAIEKFRGRDLVTVGLCTNPANDSEKVTDFIKSHRLTWPQLYDGKGTRGELFAACFGTAAGAYCVIDREGNVAAIIWAAHIDKLPASLEKALAGP